MYKLYRQQNGQVQQVPVNTPEEDTTPPNIKEAYPNPLQAKGEPNGVAPFVLQEQKQFDLIKENETQQAKFQTNKLQFNNYQIFNMQIAPTDSATTDSKYRVNYNDAIAVGNPLDSGVMFGTDQADVTEAKYYNLVYANVRLGQDVASSSDLLVNPSYMEFYLMQKLPTGDFGGKIPRQIEAKNNSTGVSSIKINDEEYGVQSFGVDVYNENAYYTQTADLKGMRCCGVALKRIHLNFSSDVTLSAIRLNVELGYDLKTEGNNY